MSRVLQVFLVLGVSLVAGGAAAGESAHEKKGTGRGAETTDGARPVLWRDPMDLASRDLFYGTGGEKHAPRTGTYTFIKEDLDGSNPKYVVRDDAGVKWKIKLGAEAKPEIAATRLVWAVGYFTDEDYFLPEVRVLKLPPDLHRGKKRFAPDGGCIQT